VLVADAVRITTPSNPRPKPSAGRDQVDGRRGTRSAKDADTGPRDLHPLKALYSEARKRAGVAAGIGAYLYTALEWTVLCYVDLETLRPDNGENIPTAVDYKVKTAPLAQFKADHELPTLRLPRRTVARGRPGRRILLR
jgi:hypothetical protein